MIIKASALSTVVPDGRDLGIFTHIGGMLDNKEFAHSVPVSDTFSVSFLVRSVPDSTSEVDIWDGWMKEEKRTVLLLRMSKPPRISTICLIGKGLYCKERSAREIGPDR